MLSTRINKIIYDPLSYICEDRFHFTAKVMVENRPVINAIIYSLFSLESGVVVLNNKTKFWINNWHLVQDISFLIGCIACKDMIFRKGRIFKYPLWIRVLLMKLPYHIDRVTIVSSDDNLSDVVVINEGFAQLNGYIEELPVLLSSRIKLMFPKSIDSIQSQHKIEKDILNMVSIYVKKNRENN